jgi:predicted RNA-binding protein with PIN domain
MARPSELESSLADAVTNRGDRPIALIDGRNVQRSQWPNLSDEELVTRCCRWARGEQMYAVIVFDGRTDASGDGESCMVVPVLGETADEWLIRATAALRERGIPFWLVTSDRELRALASRGAERVIGGGGFLKSIPK